MSTTQDERQEMRDLAETLLAGAYPRNVAHLGDDEARIILALIDEVERPAEPINALQAERDRAQKACEQMGVQIIALRKALEWIVSDYELSCSQGGGWGDRGQMYFEKARAALAAHKEENDE